MSLSDLETAIKTNNEDEIISNLRKILSQGSDIELQNATILTDLLPLQTAKITPVFVETAAEWAKSEHNRPFFTNKDIISYFLQLLDAPEESLVVGAIRVLGNICYENEEARTIIGKEGLATVVGIVAGDNQRKNNLLTLKASGFLVNLLIAEEELQKAAIKYDVIGVIQVVLEKYLKKFNENQMLFAFLLTVLNNVLDYIDDLAVPFNESLCMIIIEVFKRSQTPEVSVLCLELLHGQCDKEEIKILLAKHGVCELVFELIEKYRSQVNDEETRSVMKMACDMIVIILTGDECMHILYNNGTGKLYEDMISWLDSTDPDLLSTGVLALGNFARKDTNCIQMVQNGIAKKLIQILSDYNTSQSDLKVQHALLSTLKNLVIPQENKARILNDGLIDVIYPILKIEQYLVIFKLLGTFRMVIDGQESAAMDLISRRDFLERLMFWCYNSDHLGVRGEIPRLIAWLIKNCKSIEALPGVLQVDNCVKCLVEMISSNHSLMQNESFCALNSLCLGAGTPVLFQQLIDADVGKNLGFVISKYSEKMDQQTLDNLLTLLENLNTAAMVEHLKVLKDSLVKLKSNPHSDALPKLSIVLESFA